MEVELYPWTFHCHICDPQQPYRRGETGKIVIILMGHPHQRLTRVFGECLVRLPLYQQHARMVDSQGNGIARLWRRINVNDTFSVNTNNSTSNTTSNKTSNNKQAKTKQDVPTSSRFGPWCYYVKTATLLLPWSVRTV